METSYNWWVIIQALQVICIVGIGYRICFLVKRDLVLAKVKSPAQSPVRVSQSPRQ